MRVWVVWENVGKIWKLIMWGNYGKMWKTITWEKCGKTVKKNIVIKVWKICGKQ
jgi:hypothetical protein